jgi:hypothetical protein
LQFSELGLRLFVALPPEVRLPPRHVLIALLDELVNLDVFVIRTVGTPSGRA